MAAGETTQFYLRPPKGRRKGYAIIRRKRDPTGKTSGSETVDSPAIRSINEQLVSGGLAAEEAREAARRELARVRDAAGGGRKQTLRPVNNRLAEKYWDAVFEHRSYVDQDSAWNRLVRGVAALGDTPLTADRDVLQAAVNKATVGKPVRQREAVSVLNGLLRWMGRADIRLTKVKKPRRRVRHLTLAELALVLPHVADADDRDVFRRAIYTGTRVGEQFGLRAENLRPDGRTIYVDTQMRRDGSEGETKNRRTRDIPILPEGQAVVREWLDVAWDVRTERRNRRYAEMLKEACKKAFPGKPEKHLTLHNLRDSYAIHLLQRGVPIALVAQALGDTIAVVQESYVGFVLTAEGLDQVHAKLAK